MDAVILAAGKGTRMKPLTTDTPKPLLPVAGKPVIDHTLTQLEPFVDNVVVVAGYKENQLRTHFENRDNVLVVTQDKPLGTAHAAMQAADHVSGKTMVLMGDDLYTDLNTVAEHDRAVLAAQVDNPSRYGVFTVEQGTAEKLVEKPDNPESNLVNTGCYIVQEDFFPLLENVDKSERGEHEITDAIQTYLTNHDVVVEQTTGWKPCSYPWQLLDAHEALMEHVERDVQGTVHETAVVDGSVVVENGAHIEAHAVVEGPAIIKTGAVVKPHSHIRPGTVLHKEASVKHSEVKNSVIGPGTTVPHFNYVGDSYIWKNVNLGAGTITANTRNDDKNVKMMVKEALKETGRRKLGAVIGSNTKTGVNCSINPGRVIGANTVVDSHEKITENIPSNVVWKNGEQYAHRD